MVEPVDVGRVSILIFCRSLASGCVDRSSVPTDISPAEAFASELPEAVDSFLLFFETTSLATEGYAQPGTGCNRSN